MSATITIFVNELESANFFGEYDYEPARDGWIAEIERLAAQANQSIAIVQGGSLYPVAVDGYSGDRYLDSEEYAWLDSASDKAWEIVAP